MSSLGSSPLDHHTYGNYGMRPSMGGSESAFSLSRSGADSYSLFPPSAATKNRWTAEPATEPMTMTAPRGGGPGSGDKINIDAALHQVSNGHVLTENMLKLALTWERVDQAALAGSEASRELTRLLNDDRTEELAQAAMPLNGLAAMSTRDGSGFSLLDFLGRLTGDALSVEQQVYLIKTLDHVGITSVEALCDHIENVSQTSANPEEHLETGSLLERGDVLTAKAWLLATHARLEEQIGGVGPTHVDHSDEAAQSVQIAERALVSICRSHGIDETELHHMMQFSAWKNIPEFVAGVLGDRGVHSNSSLSPAEIDHLTYTVKDLALHAVTQKLSTLLDISPEDARTAAEALRAKGCISMSDVDQWVNRYCPPSPTKEDVLAVLTSLVNGPDESDEARNQHDSRRSSTAMDVLHTICDDIGIDKRRINQILKSEGHDNLSDFVEATLGRYVRPDDVLTSAEANRLGQAVFEKASDVVTEDLSSFLNMPKDEVKAAVIALQSQGIVSMDEIKDWIKTECGSRPDKVDVRHALTSLVMGIGSPDSRDASDEDLRLVESMHLELGVSKELAQRYIEALHAEGLHDSRSMQDMICAKVGTHQPSEADVVRVLDDLVSQHIGLPPVPSHMKDVPLSMRSVYEHVYSDKRYSVDDSHRLIDTLARANIRSVAELSRVAEEQYGVSRNMLGRKKYNTPDVAMSMLLNDMLRDPALLDTLLRRQLHPSKTADAVSSGRDRRADSAIAAAAPSASVAHTRPLSNTQVQFREDIAGLLPDLEPEDIHALAQDCERYSTRNTPLNHMEGIAEYAGKTYPSMDPMRAIQRVLLETRDGYVHDDSKWD